MSPSKPAHDCPGRGRERRGRKGVGGRGENHLAGVLPEGATTIKFRPKRRLEVLWDSRRKIRQGNGGQWSMRPVAQRARRGKKWSRDTVSYSWAAPLHPHTYSLLPYPFPLVRMHARTDTFFNTRTHIFPRLHVICKIRTRANKFGFLE